ncbi:MAG: M50 family metallopeptidase [Fimbriimonadaceae bacterium]|nr:M50 family metallopeptidase [Fimbriimonadaceae bacterium]
MKPKKSSTLRTLLWIDAAFAGFFALMLLLVSGKVLFSLLAFLIILPILPIALALVYFPIFIHEYGHFWAARRQGFTVAVFAFGPFEWTLQTGGWKERTADDQRRLGGYVFAYPDDEVRVLERFRAMIWGGPIANLVLALVSFGLWLYLNASFGYQTWAFPVFLVLHWFWISGLLLGLVSLIPYQSRGFLTDGAHLLSLSKGGDEARRTVAIVIIMGCVMKGMLAKDWPAHLAPLLLVPEDDTRMHSQGLYLASFLADAQEDFELAREQRERALAIAEGMKDRLPILEAGIRTDLAYLVLSRFDELENAKSLMTDLPDPLTSVRGWVTRSEALIALKSGDPVRAIELAETAKSELLSEKRMADTPSYQKGLKSLEEMIEQARTAQEPAASNLTPE